jgi:hypothetical protein
MPKVQLGAQACQQTAFPRPVSRATGAASQQFAPASGAAYDPALIQAIARPAVQDVVDMLGAVGQIERGIGDAATSATICAWSYFGNRCIDSMLRQQCWVPPAGMCTARFLPVDQLRSLQSPLTAATETAVISKNGSASGQAIHSSAAVVPVKASDRQILTTHSVGSTATVELLTCRLNYTATSVQLPQPATSKGNVCKLRAGFVAVMKQLCLRIPAVEAAPAQRAHVEQLAGSVAEWLCASRPATQRMHA